MTGINAPRLLQDLRELASFGKAGSGVHRLAYSAEDIAARQWLLQRMSDAGLDARIDAVGNVYGSFPEVARTVLIGSHSDTVPNGGWLDGALGIVYGLEIARVLRERHSAHAIGVDVVSFADEEGTFLSWFGSRHFCGEISAALIAGARNVRGEKLSDALALFPFRGAEPAALDRERHVAYFEPHIEQGPRLELENRQIGVVTGIVGIRNYFIKTSGRADHAGTTPMNMRCDAGAALIRTAHRLLQEFEAASGPSTVWNFGTIAFVPGGRSVVPGEAELAVQFRDENVDILHRFEEILYGEVDLCSKAGPVACSCTRFSASDPVPMDTALSEQIVSAAEARQIRWMHMPSGAGHDAAVVGKYIPAAMMFIPSLGGRSHCPDEDSREVDIVLGADLAFAVVERILDL